MHPRVSLRVLDRSIQESKRVKQKITRKAAAPKVIGKRAGKPARPMLPGAGIGAQPPKFVPQPRKK